MLFRKWRNIIKPFLWRESLLTEYLPLILSDMKKLSKIKLSQLNKAELGEREMNRLLGGSKCCICRGQANLDANVAGGTSGLIPADGGGGTGAGAFK